MMLRVTATVILVGMASAAWADGPKKPEKSVPWAQYNQGVRWEASLQDALKKAKESGKPVLVHQLVGDMKAEGC